MSGYKRNYEPRQQVVRVPFVPKYAPSAEQRIIFDHIRYGDGNLHGEAAAGSGKTTTALWGMTLDKNKSSTALLAFSAAIVKEIEPKAPHHVDAKTAHAFGRAALVNRFGGNIEVKKGYDSKTGMILKDYDWLNWYAMKSQKKAETKIVFQNIERLVSLMKLMLVNEYDREGIYGIIDRYNLEFVRGNDKNGIKEDITEECIAILPRVFDRIREMTTVIDFEDMMWLPIQYDLPIRQYEMLYVDEAQDLSNLLAEFAGRMRGDRIFTIGDTYQAIFGFAGANTDSIANLKQRFDSKELSLMTCYRCGKKIIEYVNKVMPDIKAFEGNGDGEVNEYWDGKFDYGSLEEGTMVLARRNAALIKPCFALLKAGKKATIKGRDIGQQLINLADNIGGDSIIQFIDRLEVWRDETIEVLEKRTNPPLSKIEAINDQHDALKIIADGCSSVYEVKGKLGSIFSDETKEGVICSSIHRSKGLEADRVVITNAKNIRLSNDRMREEDHIQERNLEYVAKTRAKHRLDVVYDE